MAFAFRLEVYDKDKAERAGKPGAVGFSFDGMTLEQARAARKYLVVMLDKVTAFEEKELRRMALIKHGVGEVLPEPGDNVKVAKQEWTDKDKAALAEENDDRPGE